MKTKIILLLSIVMLSFACKNSKKTSKSEGVDNYRVIVSFISTAAGSDTKAIASLESYVISFGKKENKTIAYDKYPWGREGEVDYCFYLKELKKGAQDDFVTGLNNLAKGSKLIIIKENAACSHKK